MDNPVVICIYFDPNLNFKVMEMMVVEDNANLIIIMINYIIEGRLLDQFEVNMIQCFITTIKKEIMEQSEDFFGCYQYKRKAVLLCDLVNYVSFHSIRQLDSMTITNIPYHCQQYTR